MRGIKKLLSTQLLLATALIGLGTLAPTAEAQISINIGVDQPNCQYGYYDYEPYSCAPMGFYGSGYFYNGIFLGMGPWAGYGYGHGWGRHRFINDGGGRYRGEGGRRAYQAYSERSRGPQNRGPQNQGVRREGNGRPQGMQGRPQGQQQNRPQGQQSRPQGQRENAAPRQNGGGQRPQGGGGRPNGGGQQPGGGGQRPGGGGGHPEGHPKL